MATVAYSAIRAAPDSSKYLLIGVLAVGGGLAWYYISQNPLGQIFSKWSSFALNPMGFIKDTFNYGFSTFGNIKKECSKGTLAKRLGCGVGGAGKAGFGFFSR